MLTLRQKEVLECIKTFIKEHHYPPSVEDLCYMAGVTSTATIHFHLEALREKGFVNWTRRAKRTLHVVEGRQP